MQLQKPFFLALFLAFFSFAACTDAPESDDATVGDAQEESELGAEAQQLDIDLQESKVEWIGTKTNGRHNGYVNIKDGWVAVEGNEVTGGKFVMDMTTVQATDEKMDEESNTKLTGHLKSEDFFEVENYPEATFTITEMNKITSPSADQQQDDISEIEEYRITDPTHMVTGNLTIKDVTKSVTFPAKVEITDNEVTARANFNINRQDWNLKWNYPPGEVVLNNTINLGFVMVADR